MSRYYLLIITIFAFAGLLVSCGKKSDTATKSPAVERSLGKVEFANSCDPKVQQTLNSSLALLHHMMYGQAETEFLKVSEMDPECPMAHWGIAMTQFHPLWAPPSHAELEKGFNAIERAIKLNPKTKREQEFVVAAKAFYDGWQTVDHKTRIAAWSEGQKLVYENNPGDIDAGAFYALSLLATAPKKIKDYTNQKLAGGLLENLIKTAPEHPGLFHYTIHAYDNPELASRAVPVARRYDKLAPNVPHALHMPSHIFVRLGYWPETIDWNIRSANAAEEQSKDFMILHYMHAVDYLVYAYLQQGQYGAVSELLEKVNRLKYHQDSFIAAYGIAAAQCRSALERGSWKEASEIAVKTHGEFPWGNYPQYEAIYFYAKGLGSVKSGDVETARVNKARLDELYSSTVDNGEVYWSVIVDAQRKTIDAWIKFISGDKDNGLQMMIAAADLEDSVDKHPVTPGSVMPARDMLGDMLLLVNKPEAALIAYQKSLEISPRRFNGLYGAGYSAELSGKIDTAKRYYKELLEVAADADENNDKLNHAKMYLN